MGSARARVAAVIAGAALALALGPTSARAEEPDDVDEHGDVRHLPVPPLPRLVVSAGLAMGELEHGGLMVSAPHLMTEVAVGVAARWQVFGEAAIGRGGTAEPMRLGATLLRAGGGVRWLARQFQTDTDMAFAMFVEAGLGHTAIAWDDRGHAAHDELMVGVGQVSRGQLGDHELQLRFGLRVLMRLDDVPALVGSGGRTELDRGALGLFALGWGPRRGHGEGRFPIDPPRVPWRRTHHTLGFGGRFGALTIDGGLRAASSLGVHGGGLALTRFTRLDGEYDLVVYRGGGRNGVGQRAGLIVHHPLWGSARQQGALYLAGELGAGGSWLRDEERGRLLVPDALVGARFGFDGRAIGPSPSRRYGLHATARAVLTPDGLGVLAGFGVEWGE